MRQFIRVIDKLNEKTGMAVRWVAVGMLLTTSYEVIARYFFNAPTVWAHQTVMILGGVFVALSWGWVHLHHGHVNMDILLRRLPPRGQAIVNVVCSLLFLFPLLGFMIWISSEWMVESWVMQEKWMQSVWRPPMGPSRSVITLGFTLFFLQGAAHFLRDLHFSIRGEAL